MLHRMSSVDPLGLDTLPAVTVSPARALHDAGLTDIEIASELGLTVGQVARLPELADALPGPAHAARVERALVEAALPGTSWREVPVAGELQRAESYRPPDVAAAKALLAAHRPERYGAAAQDIRPPLAPIAIQVQFVSVTGKVTGQLPAIDVQSVARLPELTGPGTPGGRGELAGEGVGDSVGTGTIPIFGQP